MTINANAFLIVIIAWATATAASAAPTFYESPTELWWHDSTVHQDQRAQIVDVNGDGLPDFVQAYLYGTQHSLVFLNTGCGWIPAKDWQGQTSYCKSAGGAVTLTHAGLDKDFVFTSETTESDMRTTIARSMGVRSPDRIDGARDASGRVFPLSALASQGHRLPARRLHLVVKPLREDKLVTSFLAELDLGRYGEAFAEAEVSWSDLALLDDAALLALGLPVGPRLRIREAISVHKQRANAAPQSSAAVHPGKVPAVPCFCGDSPTDRPCHFVDLNGDGLVDLVWTRFSSTHGYGMLTFHNTGDAFCLAATGGKGGSLLLATNCDAALYAEC